MKVCKKCKAEMLKRDEYCINCGKTFISNYSWAGLIALVITVIVVVYRV